jgi:hypothetical protein
MSHDENLVHRMAHHKKRVCHLQICEFFSFLQNLSCNLHVPSISLKQDNLTFWPLLFANLSAFSFLQTWRFACASLLVLTHSHPFLWVPQKIWSHPDNCTCCFELAQAFLCLPPTQRSKHTQEKFIPESKLCAKSLEVVSYKLSSRSARRLAKIKDLMTCHEPWPKHILNILLQPSYCMIWT